MEVRKEVSEIPKKFYQKTWFIVVMLLLFYPVGIWLMWRQGVWSKLTRIIITVILGLSFVFGIFSKPDNSDIASKEKQTQVTVTEKSEQGKKQEKKEEKKKEDKKKTDKKKQIEYMDVNINTLIREANTNAAAASRKYKGKRVRLTGILKNIESDADYISIGGNEDLELIGVQAFTNGNKRLKDAVVQLRNGQQITVCGRITDVGEILGYSMDIESFPISLKEAMRVVRGVWKNDAGETLRIDFKNFGKETYTASEVKSYGDETEVTLAVNGGEKIIKVTFNNADRKHITVNSTKYKKAESVGTAP